MIYVMQSFHSTTHQWSNALSSTALSHLDKYNSYSIICV